MPTLLPAVFLDRDGTLIEDAGYCSDPALVRVIPGAPDALRRLRDAGFRLIIVTNQSGIGRGYYTIADYEKVHARTLEVLDGAVIDATYFCPEAPEANSPRRKPQPGMLFEAARDHGLDLSRSWMVGDKTADVKCGLAAGCRSILVQTGEGHRSDPAGAAYVAKDIADAVDFILKHRDASP